jgi:hypothetical protein
VNETTETIKALHDRIDKLLLEKTLVTKSWSARGAEVDRLTKLLTRQMEITDSWRVGCKQAEAMLKLLACDKWGGDEADEDMRTEMF